jgi:acid phosphatase (class A)
MLNVNWRLTALVFVFAGASLLFAGPSGNPPGLAPDDFDFKQLLGDPPAAGSTQEKAEIDQLLKLQSGITPAEIERCKSEVSVQPFYFAKVVGDWFSAENLPETDKLLKLATKDSKPIFGAAKTLWNRARPYDVSNQIHPSLPKEQTPSYPSGHATRGVVWATIIAELVPKDKAAIMACGRQIGDDRALAGVHFPSDVIAGQMLGREIAKRLLTDPDFQTQFVKAKAECAAHATLQPTTAK